MPRVKLTVKDCYYCNYADGRVETHINALLCMIKGKVEVQWPAGKSMQYCRDAMHGKVDDLSVYIGVCNPTFLEVDAETVKFCMPELRALSIDGWNRE